MFLPTPHHIGIVVKDRDRTLEVLKSWGIEIRRARDFTPPKEELMVGEQYSLKCADCKLGSMELQVIEPVWGKSCWSDFLETKGEGIQHIAFGCTPEEWDERVAKAKELGWKMVAGGMVEAHIYRWCYFDTGASDIVIEFEEV
jgi:hypothetical protein